MANYIQKFKSLISLLIPFFIRFLLKFYLIGLLIFLILRIVLLFHVADESIDLSSALTIKSFTIGFQFDTVVLSYILVLPLLLLFIQSTFKIKRKIIPYIVTFYFTIITPIIFFLTIADIPYFKFFQNRITESAFQWLTDFGTVFNMIISNSENMIFLILSIICSIILTILCFKYCKKNLLKRDWSIKTLKFEKIYFTIIFLLFGFVTFIGVRGKLTHPIRTGDAIYCNNPILNQIGLNPLFTILKSYSNKVKLMKDDKALEIASNILKIKDPIKNISPIARKIQYTDSTQKHNIIVILMEGMSAEFMNEFGNTNNLTPTLDSLAQNSYFFKNAYSSGIHTNNGVFSTLYSFPALKRIRPMSTVPVRTYSGLPYTLKQNGYTNIFFCTHAETFDNLVNFIPANFFDELYTAEDFPSEKSIGPFGVADDYLFEKTIERINKFDSNQLFFASILTASNHDPYIVPEYYQSKETNKEFKAISYADWSIKQFINKAKNCKWFNNTIFVFVSDHGRIAGKNLYDMPLSYNHIPIMFYAPNILKTPQKFDNLMGQIDIYPTLMGMLKINYINNTLGMDILNNPRESIYFSADNKIGCIDNEWLYIYRFGGGESLYQYKTGNQSDFSKTNVNVFEKLKNAALSQTQEGEWLYSNDKTKIIE